MGAVRDQMIEEMELRGLSAATKKSYLTCCRVFVAHFMKPPETLREEDVKAFLLHLMRDLAVDAQLGELPVERVPGGAGFVADLEALRAASFSISFRTASGRLGNLPRLRI